MSIAVMARPSSSRSHAHRNLLMRRSIEAPQQSDCHLMLTKYLAASDRRKSPIGSSIN